MDWLKSLFLHQWQRKLVALLAATLIWVFVSHSITDTKMVPNVPIRIINLPEDKTVSDMQPNGIIGKRVPLTLSGGKDAIHSLEPGDIEVLLDASAVEQNDWLVQISKKNLVSLNPAIDLARHISDVQHPELIIKFSELMSAKIPVIIKSPKGASPPGYEYLDIWPQHLVHTILGPQELVHQLIDTGLELQIDMQMISKADLDKIKSSRENFHDDEVSFFIPAHWKKVLLPCKGGLAEELNDPEAQNLHIDFLRREYLPISKNIPLRVFYPLDRSQELNPLSAPLLTAGKVKKEYDVTYLLMPLFVRDVSRLFLEVVQDHLEIVVIAEERPNGSPLNWSLQVIDSHLLEEKYVKALVSHATTGTSKSNEPRHTKKRESHLRIRFREYLQKLALFTAPEKKLQIDARLVKEGISVIPSSM